MHCHLFDAERNNFLLLPGMPKQQEVQWKI